MTPTPEQALLDRLLELNEAADADDDLEYLHIAADNALCAYIRSQGLEAQADAFEKLPKWYA